MVFWFPSRVLIKPLRKKKKEKKQMLINKNKFFEGIFKITSSLTYITSVRSCNLNS